MIQEHHVLCEDARVRRPLEEPAISMDTHSDSGTVGCNRIAKPLQLLHSIMAFSNMFEQTKWQAELHYSEVGPPGYVFPQDTQGPPIIQVELLLLPHALVLFCVKSEAVEVEQGRVLA